MNKVYCGKQDGGNVCTVQTSSGTQAGPLQDPHMGLKQADAIEDTFNIRTNWEENGKRCRL